MLRPPLFLTRPKPFSALPQSQLQTTITQRAFLSPHIVDIRQLNLSPCLKGIIFDMDGTLTLPNAIDFKKMRSRIGVEDGQDVLKFIKTLSPRNRAQAIQIIEDEEMKGLERTQLQEGLVDLLSCLISKDIKLAILTRNAPFAVQHFLNELLLPSALRYHPFSLGSTIQPQNFFGEILTRDFTPTKPAPDPVLHICHKWNLSTDQVMMVGDHRHDIQAGSSAGCYTTMIQYGNSCANDSQPNFVISDLREIPGIIEQYFN